VTTRWHIAEAETRMEVGQRLQTLARSAERRARRLHDDRIIVAERRRDLEMQLGSAELALSRVPPLPVEAAPSANSSGTEPSRADLLVAYQAHTIPLPDADAEPVAPAAGPANGAYGDIIDDLGRLALLAPDADAAMLPFVAPLPLATQGQWPISGEVTRSFDEEGLGPLDRGLTFASDLVQPVRTPRAGTIVFAGPFMSFGLLLIVDHGHEYHSLLAGMARLDVRVGDVVVAGQAVGSIAGSEAEPARLYLELRHNGRPVNPLPWLAAREDKVRG
jgi:murein DD-endopeptidase MepM/ murein hydrolase activator NlpD